MQHTEEVRSQAAVLRLDRCCELFLPAFDQILLRILVLLQRRSRCEALLDAGPQCRELPQQDIQEPIAAHKALLLFTSQLTESVEPFALGCVQGAWTGLAKTQTQTPRNNRFLNPLRFGAQKHQDRIRGWFLQSL